MSHKPAQIVYSGSRVLSLHQATKTSYVQMFTYVTMRMYSSKHSMEKELNADLERRRIFSELLHSINRLKFHLHLQVEMPETNVDFYLLAENIYI